MGVDDLIDDSQERLPIVGSATTQIQTKTHGKFTSRCGIVFRTAFHFIVFENNIPCMKRRCLFTTTRRWWCFGSIRWGWPCRHATHKWNKWTTASSLYSSKRSLIKTKVGGALGIFLNTVNIPCCMRSLIATANSRLTMVVTRGEVIRNSGCEWASEPCWELSSEAELVVVQSVSVRHSIRLHASKIWSTASSSLALRSLGKEW